RNYKVGNVRGRPGNDAVRINDGPRRAAQRVSHPEAWDIVVNRGVGDYQSPGQADGAVGLRQQSRSIVNRLNDYQERVSRAEMLRVACQGTEIGCDCRERVRAWHLAEDGRPGNNAVRIDARIGGAG